MACGLSLRSLIWILIISVSFFFDFVQFHEEAWWSTSQWQHLTSILMHLTLFCLWLLHLAHVAIVSRHLFIVPIFKEFRAAHWSFIIFVNFSFCLVSRDFHHFDKRTRYMFACTSIMSMRPCRCVISGTSWVRGNGKTLNVSEYL